MKGAWITDTYAITRRPGTARVWRVARPLSYRTAEGLEIAVLPGWDTDGASIPAMLRWWAAPFAGRYVAAAIVHDALYRGQHPLVDRSLADAVFKEAMLVSGVRPSRAWTIWLGVRAGGWLPWRHNAACAPEFRRKYLSVSKK